MGIPHIIVQITWFQKLMWR